MPVIRDKLLTASDLASICEVDLKTIHNWVERGKIKHFRTPGRHLRFRSEDVVEFLHAYGYSVPRELCRDRRVLIVGEITLAAAPGVSVQHAEHPYDALVIAGAEPADVYVIDAAFVAASADVASLLNALHRASPHALIIAAASDASALPAFAVRVAPGDVSAIAAVITGAPASAATGGGSRFRPDTGHAHARDRM